MTEISLNLEQIQPNSYNPNRMELDKYNALLEDMKENGPSAIDPIRVRSFGKDTYIITDGEHRWKAALQLGWKEIRCIIEDISESEARIITFRKNRERGALEPFREARFFKEEKGTPGVIGKRYGVDQTYVKKSLNLLTLNETVQQLANSETAKTRFGEMLLANNIQFITKRTIDSERARGISGTIDEKKTLEIQQMAKDDATRKLKTIPDDLKLARSHLDILTMVPRECQEDLAFRIILNDWNMQELQREADYATKQWTEKEELRKAVVAAQMKKCPECGSEPGSTFLLKLVLMLKCSSYSCYNSWPVKMTQEEWDKEHPQRLREEKSKRRIVTKLNWIRHQDTADEIGKRISKYIDQVISQVKNTSHVRMMADLDDKRVDISWDDRYFHFALGKKSSDDYISDREIDFQITLEPKQWKRWPEKTRVNAHIYEKLETQENLDLLRAWLDKGVLLGELPPRWKGMREQSSIVTQVPNHDLEDEPEEDEEPDEEQ